MNFEQQGSKQEETLSTQASETVLEKAGYEEGAAAVRSAQEKLHELYQQGQMGSSEYQLLGGMLMKQEDGQNVWRTADELDVGMVQATLESINQNDLLKRGRSEIVARHASESDSSAYRELYSALTKDVDGVAQWKEPWELDSNDVEQKLATLVSAEAELDVESRNIETSIEPAGEREKKILEGYLQRSKIADRGEALRKIMEFAHVSTEEELIKRLGEKDGKGYPAVDLSLTPDPFYGGLIDPSDEALLQIRDAGEALGYAFYNTSGYKEAVRDIIDNLRQKGEVERAEEIEKMFAKQTEEFEAGNWSQLEKVDDSLIDLSLDEAGLRSYAEEIRNLPPDASFYLYHGLNRNGGIETALGILSSDVAGIKQGTGPTLSLTPLGSYWSHGGFRYKLRRDQVEFPGEQNPNAVVRMITTPNGIPDLGFIVSDSGTLPLSEFEADVLRAKDTMANPEAEAKLMERLGELGQARLEKEEARTKE